MISSIKMHFRIKCSKCLSISMFNHIALNGGQTIFSEPDDFFIRLTFSKPESLILCANGGFAHRECLQSPFFEFLQRISKSLHTYITIYINTNDQWSN